MKATFENSVDVLVKAYFNDTLEHENCYACAVGNLVCAAKGYSYVNDGGLITDSALKNLDATGANWFDAIMDDGDGYLSRDAKSEISATGYTAKQIIAIEQAFESVDQLDSEDDWMFNGLMAVVDVLAEIHGVDLSTKQAAIGQFETIHATK